MDEGRVKAFRRLKPSCVELSQVALRYKLNKATAKDLLKCLEQLNESLQLVGRFLDPKLADYVFFPLSYIFGESKKLPSRVLELALCCLRVLIIHGWRDQLSSEVGKQLLILLAFIAGGSATHARSKEVNEDVGTIAFECITSLFQSSVASSIGSDKAVRPENIPLLGHTVTVVLDGISNGPASKVCLAACSSLQALVAGVQDQEALKNFFPGIVSSLTKVLASGTKLKISSKVLEACVHNIDLVICETVGDNTSLSTKSDLAKSKETERVSGSWAKATSDQVKMALSSIIPLRYHQRQEVQDAFFSFCISILTRCRIVLRNCAFLMLESLVTLTSSPLPESSSQRRGRLQQVLASDAELADLLKEGLYDWLVALPRVVGSNDEAKQRRTLEQLSNAFGLLSTQNVDIKALGDLTVSNIQSSVAAMVQMSSNRTINSLSEGSDEVGRILQSTELSRATRNFDSILSSSVNHQGVVSGLQTLILELQRSSISTVVQWRLVGSLRSTSGHEQIGSLWFILQWSQHPLNDRHETDQWLNLPSDGLDPTRDEAYAFALEVLENSAYDDTVDWRLQALSLEAVALQARSQAKDFRPELVDTLYPILERMGSSNAALQQYAVTCLSIVSKACGYSSASELVTDNADYLVNAVAIKLNTFDISPQASQVMLMMVRLCGSDLIPYLDDLIESIFAILACYHGYPRLVESLFEVLNAIVQEGGKSPHQAIEPDTEPTSNRRQPYKPTAISALIAHLQDLRSKSSDPLSPLPSPPLEPDDNDISPPPPTSNPTPPPLSKTHSLIHNITLQTTHHLSTPSAPLRRLLLTLLTSSIPTLATRTPTDTFLPLLAIIYPHITRPLFPSPTSKTTSKNPTIATTTDLPTHLAALTTLSTTLQYGTSFLLSRLEDDFPHLLTLYHTLEKNILAEEKQLGRARAARSLKYKCWD
ncbi:MAG: hypothetical protein Q9170_004821, partial [Blastenia crenularia]